MAQTLAMSLRNFATDLRSKVASGDKCTLAVLTLALFCAVAPFDITQLLLTLAGAAAYAILQPLEAGGKTRRKGAKVVAGGPVPAGANPIKSTCQAPSPAKPTKYVPPALRGAAGNAAAESPEHGAARRQQPGSAAPTWGARRQQQKEINSPQRSAGGAPRLNPSAQPVSAPTFKAVGWNAQVDELVDSLMPTPASDQAVERLAKRIQAVLREVVPEAEVTAFASGAISRGRAFGVAVPDVDVVVSCGPSALTARLFSAGGRAGRGSGQQQLQQRLEGRHLQKAALRAFTDRLVASGDFKFRRSAFSADEPKVTLLASGSAIAAGEEMGMPLDLAVNCPSPLHNAALLTECGSLDSRARALALLVRRWARDRGICHAAKGHLSPYCWTLLSIFFLQAGEKEGSQVLPPLGGFKASSSLASGGAEASAPADANSAAADKTVGELFREFIEFYGKHFDARTEAISVRAGRRAPPSLKLPLHVVVDEVSGASEVAPSIEDPFDAARNLAEGLTAAGLARFREELARAAALLAGAGEAPLSKLLEPWVPEEWASASTSSPSSGGSSPAASD